MRLGSSQGGAPPFAPPDFDYLETWRSQVFLTRSDVWKVKKPVRLGALDYTTLEARKRACQGELALNREFAPDVYLGVAPVTRDAEGRRRFGADGDHCGAGEPSDWALHMARLPDADRVDLRLREDRLDDECIHAIARALAVLHEAARPAHPDDIEGGARALDHVIGLGLSARAAETRAIRPAVQEAADAESWQRAFLASHAPLFEARAATGRVRDGHGELGLEHVFVDDAGRVRVIGRLEFDARLRCLDICADIAFFSADLAASERTDLAERFLAEYASAADDFDLYPLIDFYSSLRASLRARLEYFYADHFPHDPFRAEERCARARRFLLLAGSAPRRALLPPVVVAMGGLVASGKSTLARHIANEIGAPVVSSDRTRDCLLGARVGNLHEARWERSYEPGFGERVYGEVMRRAAAVLASGRPVVIDGCFRSASQRAAAREIAGRFGHPFLFVEARAPEAVQRERLRLRELRDGEPGSTWQAIADALAAEWESADDLPERERLALDSSLPLAENAKRLRTRLPTWPEGLRG